MHSGPLGPQSEDSKRDSRLLKDGGVDRDEGVKAMAAGTARGSLVFLSFTFGSKVLM